MLTVKTVHEFHFYLTFQYCSCTLKNGGDTLPAVAMMKSFHRLETLAIIFDFVSHTTYAASQLFRVGRTAFN